MRGAKRLPDFDWRGKIAVVRADLNAPLSANGAIADDSRLVAALPTIQFVLQNGGGVALLSHLGRPTEGTFDPKLSLAPIGEWLRANLEAPFRFVEFDSNGENPPPQKPSSGEIFLFENARFNHGEKFADPRLAARYAALGDVFVFDAFACAHRDEASITAVARAAAECCFGILTENEIARLDGALQNPRRPLLAVVGGAKAATKLPLLRKFAALGDGLLTGGVIGNSVLRASGVDVGASECEELPRADWDLIRPKIEPIVDAVVAPDLTAKARVVDLRDGRVEPSERIFDIGPKTRAAYAQKILAAKTVVWNGAPGVFESAPFADGTRAVADAIKQSKAATIVGGGDTLAAVSKFDLRDSIEFASTGGGAFLRFLIDGSLPGIDAVRRAQRAFAA